MKSGQKLLLSYTEAARLLGVGRGTSLHALISSGLLTPVRLLGRAKIPRAQVEALARGGDAPSPAPARKAKSPRLPESIRDLEF